MDNRYFKRDISWLSFNYRVLLEAEDETLPLYERINFISIYSSNLEEFYKIRVADHKAIATGASQSDEETMQSAAELVDEINQEVNRQLEERIRIYEQKILPALRKHHIIFYQSRNVEPFHRDFVRSFFREEIFPYLAPVPVSKDKVISFLRDNRLYLAVRLHLKGAPASSPNRIQYFVMKLPYSKVPRFIQLPKVGKDYYLMFIEDIIKANLDTIFPGYEVDSSYCIKISRDADILIDDAANTSEIIEQVKKKVKKRKIGAVCRFVYDRAMPQDFLDFLVDAYRIDRRELVPGDKHLNMEDLRHLPNPNQSVRPIKKPQPMKLTCLDERESIFHYVEKKDLLLHYPYHSFDHSIHFLYEAVHEPTVREIMVTQYRVAENSTVINTLIAAAQNGKKVTVFVELKRLRRRKQPRHRRDDESRRHQHHFQHTRTKGTCQSSPRATPRQGRAQTDKLRLHQHRQLQRKDRHPLCGQRTIHLQPGDCKRPAQLVPYSAGKGKSGVPPPACGPLQT